MPRRLWAGRRTSFVSGCLRGRFLCGGRHRLHQVLLLQPDLLGKRTKPRIVEPADNHQRPIEMSRIFFYAIENLFRIVAGDVEGRIDGAIGAAECVSDDQENRERAHSRTP